MAAWPFPQEAMDVDCDRNQYNYKSFEDEHFRYELKRFRGYALIINNTKFDHPKYHERKQSECDVSKLKDTLVRILKFRTEDVQVEYNKTTHQMQLILEDVARRDFTEQSCLVVIVLSYGESQNIIHSTNGTLTYQQLLSPFKYPKVSSLIDTPKFFVVQSEQIDSDGFDTNAVPPVLSSTTEISDPDTLFVYSSDPKSVTWRTDGQGSYFIQRLCEVIKVDWRVLDIVQIFVRVLRLVRIDYEGYVRHTINRRICCPRIVSLLTKEFRFEWED